MSAFFVAPEAKEDIFHIWLYLLREAGMETANRIEDEILGALASLAETRERAPPPRSDESERAFLHAASVHGAIEPVPHWRSSQRCMANAT